MKRIITLLLIILVSNPVIRQITKQNGQEFENLTTSKIFKLVNKHHKRFKDSKTQDFNFNQNENAKSSLAEKKSCSQTYSSKCFHETYGVLPSKYIKQYS